jgi:hypothetical protein
MEKRKKDRGLLFIAILLLLAGTAGFVFAQDGEPAPIEPMSATEDATQEESPAETTFSAILNSPASSSYIITEPVALNDAKFSFTFGEPVKNSALNSSADLVAVKKISGGSQNVASNGAIVAAANDTSKITFPSLGSNGSTSVVFTVNSTALEPGTTYEFRLNGSIVSNTSPAKTLGNDVVYTFTTAAETTVPTITFEAISIYPVKNAKDVAPDASFQIGFTDALTVSSNIANGKAIELLDTAAGTTLPAIFTVSSDNTAITIDPIDDLAYGKNYQIRILDGKIKNADSTSTLSLYTSDFKTTNFSTVTASAITSGSGLHIAASLTNSSNSDQNIFLAYVVRRDKGARLEDGGTIVVKGTSPQTTCPKNQQTEITIDLSDITIDQYGNALTKAVYVDLYVLNNNGTMLFDPIHIGAE